jgi:hypothetical protein
MQRTQPIEEIITLVATRGKIRIDEIERVFKMPNGSTRNIIEFLLKFDFVRVVNGKYLVLSETCTPFFEELLR